MPKAGLETCPAFLWSVQSNNYDSWKLNQLTTQILSLSHWIESDHVILNFPTFLGVETNVQREKPQLTTNQKRKINQSLPEPVDPLFCQCQRKLTSDITIAT